MLFIVSDVFQFLDEISTRMEDLQIVFEIPHQTTNKLANPNNPQSQQQPQNSENEINSIKQMFQMDEKYEVALEQGIYLMKMNAKQLQIQLAAESEFIEGVVIPAVDEANAKISTLNKNINKRNNETPWLPSAFDLLWYYFRN